MKIEEPDPTTDADHVSFPDSKMTRRRALSFLVGGALGAAVMFYFGFPNSPVSAASYGNSSTSTSESSTTAESSTTTTAKGGGGW